MNNVTVTIDDYWLTLLLGTVLPILVAFVTKKCASPNTKAIILAALSVITGALTSIAAAGGSFDLKTAVTGVIVTFVTAVATHFGLLKPAGVTGSQGAVAAAVPGGVGTDTSCTPDSAGY